MIDDPEYPNLKPAFREYIANQDLYKKVLPLNDHIQTVIHQIFRAQYLKDVVLARILEDDAYTLLIMFIRSKQDELLRHLFAEDSEVDLIQALQELFPDNRDNVLGFIRELSSTVKTTEMSPIFFK